MKAVKGFGTIIFWSRHISYFLCRKINIIKLLGLYYLLTICNATYEICNSNGIFRFSDSVAAAILIRGISKHKHIEMILQQLIPNAFT